MTAQALCKQHLLDLGCDPDSPVIPKQVRGQCEAPECDNSGKHLCEVDQRKGETPQGCQDERALFRE